MKDSIDFGSMDIPKLFRKLLIPTVLGMIFSAIFIITDGIFVGKGIGSDALAAVNITAPLFLINTGVALMFGIGASVVASIHLSQGKVKVARINITQAVVVSSLLLIAYAAVILCNVEKIALLLGSSPRLLPLAVEYMHWFVPFLVFSALLSSGMFFVRLDGSPNYAMVCNIIPALLNIGLETLHLRMPRHCENALKVAEYLKNHEKVAWVSYPSLPGDKYYDLAQKYMPNGTCGVLTFGLKGGRDAAVEMMDKLKMVAIVTHVADARSCVLHPASHTHRQMNEQELLEAGVQPDLIRFSVGIENVEDIIADVAQALE